MSKITTALAILVALSFAMPAFAEGEHHMVVHHHHHHRHHHDMMKK